MNMSMMAFGSKICMGDKISGDEDEHDCV